MSYYNEICAACPGKHWIKPGTNRHDGYGYESDGSKAADAARRDADHPAQPLDLRDDTAQLKMLRFALETIRAEVPAARTVTLATSDQNYYGFVLCGVQDADGVELLEDDPLNAQYPLSSLSDKIVTEIGDLEWDSVVGEDEGGYVCIDLGRWLASAS